MNAENLLPTRVVLSAPHGTNVLRLYHLYRLAIGLLLLLLISSHLDEQLLRVAHLGLFRFGSWFYLVLNILVAVLVQRAKPLQIFCLALVDVILLSGLFYTAGGTPSGIGNLIIVAVAIANILLRGRIGLLIAAVAAIGLVFMTFYLSLSPPEASAQFVQAGALGSLCFAAALFVQSLTRRLHQSESRAAQHAAELANLETLNTLILQRMRTGILVIDEEHRVLLANPSALSLLGNASLIGQPLDDHCPELVERLQQWQQNKTLRPQDLRTLPNGPLLQPSFVPLQLEDHCNILVFLEDISQIAQQAQQLKLASLGRLTAGIAHEIRNPLGAISHAAQLLQESECLDGPDRRLAQIIQDQSRRMNLVIENVLLLSRRRQAEPQLLDLKYWVHRFASEFRNSAAANQSLHLETYGNALKTRMDPQQLLQVLGNLVQNGMRYSAQLHDQAQVWLKLFCDPESDLPVLEVIDDGPGVSEDKMQHIFEPFFTTERKGTGLGLYISRELCESNQARIDYRRGETGGSCFRITFAHPRKLA